MSKRSVTLAPAPWGESDEDRVWYHLVHNNLSTAAEAKLANVLHVGQGHNEFLGGD